MGPQESDTTQRLNHHHHQGPLWGRDHTPARGWAEGSRPACRDSDLIPSVPRRLEVTAALRGKTMTSEVDSLPKMLYSIHMIIYNVFLTS